ncbi:hypothetical protein GCM10025867_36690 [Frondihabitans sucicola]|uniref:DUF1045 domain-containing protein n=1 Tax=Frondihabitans sucicola TaxID=1268041 RepID=A0ABM8GSG7_9MICO|nr:DUF1045 domain-containing protein [Frondihabitans sucicola]BDZ51428.1 hypothetical protein GCM10025867_36690 [Frondihabitans sucicola]
MTGRVAIYAAPGTASEDPAALLVKERAESWLGRAVDGKAPDAVLPDGWSRDAVDDITVDARRYGFHGTLKAPFRLAAGRTLAELDSAVARFADETAPVVIPDLALARMGGFFALVPGDHPARLHELADEVLRRFDDYRAPASEADVARRDPDALSSRQRELLERWGYPFVLDEFRFHLTVTDRIPQDRQRVVRETLTEWFAGGLGRPVAVDALALFTEAEPGAPFRLHSVHSLRSPARTRRTSGTLDHEGTR